MRGLTKRQADVLAYIKKFVATRGFPPSVREIAAHFDLVSAAGVHKHINALVRKGFLSKENFLSRSLRIVERAGRGRRRGVRELPLVGYVAAGQPIEAIQQEGEVLAVPAAQLDGTTEHFVLQVRGNSMIEDGIRDGDYVILERREEARDGEAVVALINGEEATLKRLYREGDRVRLQPANPQMQPIVVRQQELRVQGVVVGLWRSFR